MHTQVICGALERLLPLSLLLFHVWERGERPACLGYIPYLTLTDLRGSSEGLEAESSLITCELQELQFPRKP